MRVRIAPVAVLLLSAACSAATSPSSALRVSVTPAGLFPVGVAFTMRVENTGSKGVDLTFASSCQLLPSFIDQRTSAEVTPVGGGVACLTVITHQSLRPGESFSETVMVQVGTAASPPSVVLPPGDYAISARLMDTDFKLKSEPVTFSLR
jgi:hypothetical protein